MATPRTLTIGHRNRALLARQMLLARVKAPLPRVVERMGGIQAQYAPSAYVGLWSRLEGFERTQLTRALVRRSVVQGTLMRSTIHLVSRSDYWPFAVGIRRARQDWWLRIAGARRLGDIDYEAMAQHLRRVLAQGPIERSALIASLAGAGFPTEAFEGVSGWIDMVRVPPTGTWERRRASMYADAGWWLGTPEATENDGIELLLRRYLAAFGPATPGEAARWAGLPLAVMQAAAEPLSLRTFRRQDGPDLLDLPRAPIPPPSTPAPVRFIPTWDAILLAHARDSGVLSEEHRPLVFHTKNPQSVNTFLVDGTVAGTWRHEQGRIVTEPFEPLPRRARRELEDESARLTALFA